MPDETHSREAALNLSVYEQNPIAELLELKIRLTPCGSAGERIEVRAELRIKPDDIDHDNILIEVGIKRASIAFQLDGLSIMAGTRFREPYVGKLLSEKLTHESEVSTGDSHEASLAADVNAGSKDWSPNARLSAKLGLNRKRSRAESIKRVVSDDREVSPVAARGNNTWEISSDSGSILKGTYLQDNDVLFQITRNSGSNRQMLLALAMIKHRDLHFSFPDNPLKRLSLTDRRLLSIFAAKCIAGEQYAGRVVASSVRIEIE